MTLTKKAAAALEVLRAQQPFHIVPAREIRARDSRRIVTIPAHIETGINTHILSSLLQLGLIDCTRIYLRGHTTTDLRVVGQ